VAWVWTALIEYVRPTTTSSIPARRTVAASRRMRAGSLDGSAIWMRRIPLRASRRKARSITSSPVGAQEMNRIPGVIRLSGVFGMAALMSRIRCQGSSR
jgi:hypothetical protein